MQRLGVARARRYGGGVVYDDVGPTGLQPLVDSSIEVGRRRAPGLDQRGVEILAHCAEVALINGRKAEALALAHEGLEISNETGRGFTAPILYGLLALLEDRHEDQEIAFAAGEALLAQGSVGHNHFWFRRYAIERALFLEDWEEADRQSDALLLRMADEPLAYSSLVAERGHVLARCGRGGATESDEDRLRAPLAAAREFGMRIDALGLALRQV
jgi:hypothetical protein